MADQERPVPKPKVVVVIATLKNIDGEQMVKAKREYPEALHYFFIHRDEVTPALEGWDVLRCDDFHPSDECDYIVITNNQLRQGSLDDCMNVIRRLERSRLTVEVARLTKKGAVKLEIRY